MKLRLVETEMVKRSRPAELSFPLFRKKKGEFFFRLRPYFYDYDESKVKGLAVTAVFHDTGGRRVGNPFENAAVDRSFLKTADLDDGKPPEIMRHSPPRIRGREFDPIDIIENMKAIPQLEFEEALEAALSIIRDSSTSNS
jgi:hypothetical protein